MSFSIRIDLESNKGIVQGLPKILDLLKKYNLKASFYLTMGGESNIFDLIKYRKKLPGKRGIKVFSKLEMIRMILFPRNFVKRNEILIKRILSEGHELGIHGWKHRRWTRGLNLINISREINLAKKEYKKLFGKEVKTFCAPAFQINKKALIELDRAGIKIISDLDGNSPKKIMNTNIINVPITIKGKGNTPIIEYLVSEGFKDKEIYEKLKKEMKKKYATMYVHGLYECIEKIKLLEDLFKFLKINKIKVKTIEELANENIANNK